MLQMEEKKHPTKESFDATAFAQLLFGLSAYSRNLLCKEFSLFTAEVATHLMPEFTRGQKPSRLDDGTLAMHPLGLNAVEPGAFGGQPARDDAHACFVRLSFLGRATQVSGDG